VGDAVGEFGADFALPAVEHLNGLLEGTKQGARGHPVDLEMDHGNMDAAKTAPILSSAAPAASRP
jgi:hypothetical protein